MDMSFAPRFSAEPASESQTITLERVEQQESGDQDRFAHYVRKDRITQSAVEGGPVVALCGKIWTPTRDPGRFPICPACKAIYESIGSGSNAWPFGGDVPGGQG